MVVHVAVEEPSKHVRAPEWPLLISLWVCVHPLGVSAEQRPCGTDGILAPAAICDRGHLLRRWVWRRRCMMCGSLRLGCGRRRHGLERDAQCHPFCRAITCTLDWHARGKISGGRPGDELLEGTVADDPLRIFVPPLLSALGRRLVGRSSSLFGDGVTSPARRPGRSRGRSWRCRGAACLVAQYDAQVATDALNGALGRRRLGASPRAVCCRQHKSPRQSRRNVGRSSSWCSCLPLLSQGGALGVHVVQVHTGQAPVDTRAEVRAVVTLHPARCLAQPRRSARRGGTSLALAPLRHWRSLCVSSAHGGCVCLIRPHEACLLSTPGLPPWGSSQRSGEGHDLWNPRHQRCVIAHPLRRHHGCRQLQRCGCMHTCCCPSPPGLSLQPRCFRAALSPAAGGAQRVSQRPGGGRTPCWLLPVRRRPAVARWGRAEASPPGCGRPLLTAPTACVLRRRPVPWPGSRRSARTS